jgi:hypothetical protein
VNKSKHIFSKKDCHEPKVLLKCQMVGKNLGDQTHLARDRYRLRALLDAKLGIDVIRMALNGI